MKVYREIMVDDIGNWLYRVYADNKVVASESGKARDRVKAHATAIVKARKAQDKYEGISAPWWRFW